MMERTVSDGTSFRAFHDRSGGTFLPGIGVAGKTGTLTEAEWERAASDQRVQGNFLEGDRLETAAASRNGGGIAQLFGDAWEWTASAYLPYPGFRALDGALGEYNGKFMSGQLVLRGGSCFSPGDHLRATYRNFFPPHARWQMSGIRLARDA